MARCVPLDGPGTIDMSQAPGPSAGTNVAAGGDTIQANRSKATGAAVEMLRTRARELRCAGETLGAKHPLAREAIGAYLDAKAGQAGGKLTPASRAAWVEAFREISQAAAEAIR